MDGATHALPNNVVVWGVKRPIYNREICVEGKRSPCITKKCRCMGSKRSMYSQKLYLSTDGAALALPKNVVIWVRSDLYNKKARVTDTAAHVLHAVHYNQDSSCIMDGAARAVLNNVVVGVRSTPCIPEKTDWTVEESLKYCACSY